jgi:dTDP-4-amino-4,6-dideoxygalactose transaminase
VFHQYTLKLHGVDREGLRNHLAAKEIPCMIYYPVALHMQKAYQDPRYTAGMFPVTERLVEQVVSLPMHPDLTDDQLQYITTAVLEYLNS